MERVDAVNKLLPENRRFGTLWRHTGICKRFENEYRHLLLPGSNARNGNSRFLVIFAAALIVVAVDLALPFLPAISPRPCFTSLSFPSSSPREKVDWLKY